jgi:hypothetical protein
MSAFAAFIFVRGFPDFFFFALAFGFAHKSGVAGCWLLVAGCWLLVAGYWLLVAGCWLLVAGYWGPLNPPRGDF